MINDQFHLTDKRLFDVSKGLADGASLIPNVRVELFDSFGNLKDFREVHNLVTTLGKKMVADQLLAVATIAKPGWMELGTGSGQTAASSILAAFIATTRTVLDSKTRLNAVITMICTFPAGTPAAPAAITEAGVFNIVTENTTDLILYADFAVVNKLAADSLIITWTLTIG